MSKIKTLSAPVAPGGVIGILGGGQLGRMLAEAAARLGLKAAIYNDQNHAPAFQVTPLQIAAPFDDLNMLTGFAEICDVITYEFENVPAEAIAHLAALKPVRPGRKALETAQDRLSEKNFIRSLGLHTAPFAAAATLKEAEDAFVSVGAPAILKTRRWGYDGKGQAKVASAAEAVRAFEALGEAPAILEGFVDFVFEASVIAGRGADGTFAAYDPPENVHEHHILRRSTVPGRLGRAEAEEAKRIARKIAEALDYVGVLAVELFVTRDRGILVNEIAPRVHNSGHWTIEACACSQFEQHVRAVAGWPLGDPARHADAVMENIIGREAEAWASLARSGAIHLYGKRESRAGRKMGHVTRLLPRTY